MREFLKEIYFSLIANKKRSILTGIAVAWGIFLMSILLSVGNGIVAVLWSSYDYMMQNSVIITPHTTTLPYGKYKENQPLTLQCKDAALLKEKFPDEIRRISPVIVKELNVEHIDKNTIKEVIGVGEGFLDIQFAVLSGGRDFSQLDNQQMRKVCIIPEETAAVLFKTTEEKASKLALGKMINIGGLPFKVIGTYHQLKSFIPVTTIFVPNETASKLWKKNDDCDRLLVQVKGYSSYDQYNELATRIKQALCQLKGCAPNDVDAWRFEENMEFSTSVGTIIHIVTLLLWIISLMALLSGVVGVANLMLIAVRERRYELVLRRVLGASNFNIIGMILLEAVFNMLLFGYLGILLSVTVLRAVTNIILNANPENLLMSKVAIDPTTIIAATSVMIIGGVIAGWAPARKATRMDLRLGLE